MQVLIINLYYALRIAISKFILKNKIQIRQVFVRKWGGGSIQKRFEKLL